jgi:hypothetical protein
VDNDAQGHTASSDVEGMIAPLDVFTGHGFVHF